MIYKSKGPIKTSHEGIMLGNGKLGALIYGEDKLIFSLDRVDLWDNRLPKEYRNKDFNYSHLLDTLKNNYEDYVTLFGNCYEHSYPTKINAGMLVFNYKIAKDDVFSLDLKKATSCIKGSDINFNGFIDANKNVMYFKINKNIEYSIKMPEYFQKSINKKGLGYKPFAISKDGNFTLIGQPMYGKHSFGIIIYEQIVGEFKELFLSIYFDNDFEECKKEILQYVENKNIYFENHIKWWDDYYKTSSIKTCDSKVNELFEFGRYYFGANSRKDFPMTLHGVWTQNNGNLPPWKADLHNDINVQMTYEGYMKLGNYAEGKVLLDWMISHKTEFRKFAKNFMNTDGLLVPGGCTQKGVVLGGWPQYSMNPCCSIWVIKAFYDYYCYTKDIKYLEKYIYPFFVETEKCIFDLLELNEKGKYQLKIMHASPEYFENEERSVHKTQTNFELTMLRYLYTRIIEFGKILKIDTKHYKGVLDKLSEYYRDENNYLVISPNQKYDMSHRHFSHMLMYKNLELVDPFINKDLISSDIKNLERYGHKNWVGFSTVEASGLNSFIHNGEMAYKHLKDFEYFTHPNGFHMNCDYKHQGYNEFGPYVLTLESNIGYLKSLADMLIQNFEDKLVIFPAVCNKFKEEGITFIDLRTFGDHKVSGDYKNNVCKFRIDLKHKDTINLYNNLSNNPELIVDGKIIRFNSKIGSFIKINASKTIEFYGGK